MCALPNYILKLSQIKKHRIWGGERLSSTKHSKEEHIGEVFCACALTDHDSYIESEHCTLSTYYAIHKKDFNLKSSYFPLRINLIDASKDLSIQVHPDDTYAFQHGLQCGLPEGWFILDSGNSYIRLGHMWSCERDLDISLKNDSILQSVHMIPIHDEEFYYLPSGSVHAIGKNVLLYEITHQEDVTFRLYDYNRTKQDGTPRDLHIDQAKEVIYYPQSLTKTEPISHRYVDDSKITNIFDEVNVFTLFHIQVHGILELPKDDFWLITVIAGEGHIDEQEVTTYDTILVLMKDKSVFAFGDMKLLCATYHEK